MKYMAERRYPWNLKTLRAFAGVIARKNNQDDHNINFKNEAQPSSEWCRHFLKRHSLSLRSPEELSLAHTYVTKSMVTDYFNLLKSTLENCRIDDPSRIFNMDELGWGPGSTKRKVIVDKGVAHPLQQQSMCVDHVSAWICGNAEGSLIPPCLIFKGALPIKGLENAPEKWSYVATENGFSCQEVFTNWLNKCFIPNCGRARPVLLLLDKSITHLSPVAIDLACANQIELLSFPPNCTPWAQPMDQIFQHLRQAVEEVAIALRMINSNSTLSKSNFPFALKYALPRGLTKSRISGAFKSCGIYPFNPPAIDSSAYISILDPKVQMPNGDVNKLVEEEGESRICGDPAPVTVPSASSLEDTETTVAFSSTSSNCENVDHSGIDATGAVSSTLLISENTPLHSHKDKETQTSAGDCNPLVTMGVIDEEFDGILLPPNIKSRRRRKKSSRSKLLTGTEYREEIKRQAEEEERQQNEKKRKTEEATKKRELAEKRKEEARIQREEKRRLRQRQAEERQKKKEERHKNKSQKKIAKETNIDSYLPKKECANIVNTQKDLVPAQSRDGNVEYISLDNVVPCTRQCQVCMVLETLRIDGPIWVSCYICGNWFHYMCLPEFLCRQIDCGVVLVCNKCDEE